MRLNLLLTALLFLFTLIPGAAHAACTSPAAEKGEIIYNADHAIFQGCTDNGWIALSGKSGGGGGGPDPCETGPVGTACTDGALYAGMSPDGNVRMYVSPSDDSGSTRWNDGSSTWVDTAMVNCTAYGAPDVSCTTGEANTTLLFGLGTTPSPAPYAAARLCRDKGAAWYLPSIYELAVISTNRTSLGSFPATFYWSSSEVTASNAFVYLITGGSTTLNKNDSRGVRCVRK